jgi:hypothetical protein
VVGIVDDVELVAEDLDDGALELPVENELVP